MKDQFEVWRYSFPERGEQLDHPKSKVQSLKPKMESRFDQAEG